MVTSLSLPLLLSLTAVLAVPEVWPPTGKLNPNNYIPPPSCRYLQEEIMVDSLEEICTTEPVEECGEEEVEGTEEQEEEECKMVTEEECGGERGGGGGEVVDRSDEVGEGCEEVTEEKCESVYDVETKSECSYSTVMDRKCWLSYSVTYQDSCTTPQPTNSLQCSLLGLGCKVVPQCKKVPHLPRPITCRRVPRQVDRCRQVPVQRLHCGPVTRLHCPECRQVEKKVCALVKKQVPVVRREQVCRQVQKKKCTKKKVTRPQKVNKKVCAESPHHEEKEEKGEVEKVEKLLASYANSHQLSWSEVKEEDTGPALTPYVNIENRL